MKKIVPHGRNSISSATAARDERIKQILTTGVQEKWINSTDVDTFNKLRTDFEAHNDPETYMEMQKILKRAVAEVKY